MLGWAILYPRQSDNRRIGRSEGILKMTTRVQVEDNLEKVSTGSAEIDRRLGGGIPHRTLMLVEGQPAAGKSTLSQQLLWGALKSGQDASIYITEQTVQSFLRQMDSLGLSVTDYFLLDQLRIYPVGIEEDVADTRKSFSLLTQHIAEQASSRVVVVDSLTTLGGQSSGDEIIDFFSRCKAMCDGGKVIIATVHTEAFGINVHTQIRSISDAYLSLQVQVSGSQLVKTIQVAKIRGAESVTGGIIGFEVEPGLGLRIIPLSRAKA
jgi:flagellar protein FlaH